jgi:DNA invertase Pin-like site-specific DNA recombinase
MKEEKAVIYCRVSTEDQTDNTSLASQYSACRNKADDIGAEVVSYYEETASGGAYLARPKIQQALIDIESGKANILICFDFSRFSREQTHQLAMNTRIQAAGGRLVLASGMEFNDTPESDVMFTMSGAYAAYEKKKIRQRTMLGRRSKAEQGIMPNRTYVPFGYFLPTKADIQTGKYPKEMEGKYIINENLQPVVVKMFEMYANGSSLRKIADYLQTTDIHTLQGGLCWNVAAIRRILSNPVYYGKAAFGKNKTITDESRLTKGYKTSITMKPVPESEWIYIDAPAMVSKELWDKCQAKIKSNRTDNSTPDKKKAMLTGLIRCHKCETRMCGTKRTNTKQMVLKSGEIKTYYQNKAYYQCRMAYATQRPDGKVCNPVMYQAKDVEPLVIQAVKILVDSSEEVKAAYKNYATRLEDSFTEEEYKSLQRRLKELEQKERNTVEAQIQGIESGIHASVYKPVFQEIARERTTIQNKLAEFDRLKTDATKRQPESEMIADMAADIVEVLSSSDDDVSQAEKQQYLSTIVEKILSTDGDGFRVFFKPFHEGSATLVVESSPVGAVIEVVEPA